MAELFLRVAEFRRDEQQSCPTVPYRVFCRSLLREPFVIMQTLLGGSINQRQTQCRIQQYSAPDASPFICSLIRLQRISAPRLAVAEYIHGDAPLTS